MDPPEDDVRDLELISLIEETAGDDVVGGSDFDEYGGGGSPSGAGGGAGGADGPLGGAGGRGGTRGGRRFRSPPAASARGYGFRQQMLPPSAAAAGVVDAAAPPPSRFAARFALLFLTLAALVLILVVVESETEGAIEEGGLGRTFEIARHFGRGKDPAGGGGPPIVGGIGFHDPSMENIYGANRYYKPRGAGYPTAPRGGLHPIYMADLTDNETQKLAEEDYDGDDYEKSPYADRRLKMDWGTRRAEQAYWSTKLEGIRERFGYWNFTDDYPLMNEGKHRPVVDWIALGESKKRKDPSYDSSSGEIDRGDFPKGAWQADPTYTSNFLKEATALVRRVQDAIFEEYGWTEEGYPNGAVNVPERKAGGSSVAWMYEDSMHALAKKLLRAMMTNDHFYVTLGGHSAAAGHGNNFLQSYMMEFQRVMEPVFDRLGMVLVSSNLAQGGMGTLQSALAGSGIYGARNDFVLWDSSMTEKDTKPQDVFLRQALLSGGGAPVLFDMGGGRAMMDNVRREAGAFVGGASNANLLPKFKNTTINFGEKKYNAACWTERIDVPDHDVQYPKYGGQASWHPGNWGHQSSARKISLVFLRALHEALTLWEEKTTAPTDEGGGLPLDGRYWHLREGEEEIRRKLRNAKANETQCGQLFSMVPRLCTTPMRGAGEWAPRRDPDRSSIRSLAVPAPGNGYVPGMLGSLEQLYVTRDVMIPGQRVPLGEVDVAMVARSLPPLSRSRRRSLRPTPNARRHRRRAERSASAVNDPNSQGERFGSARSYYERRRLEGETKIVPGQGWTVQGHPLGFCDGTSNSICYREKTNHCLMSGHNDARGVMKGDGLSGWLVLQLKDVTEGLLLARMEMYHDYGSNARTAGWKTVNNNVTEEEGGGRRGRRRLKNANLPANWKFELAVNGVVQYSWNSTMWRSNCYYLTYNNDICVLWDDESRANSPKDKREDVEIAMRLVGEGGRNAMAALTHVYYA